MACSILSTCRAHVAQGPAAAQALTVFDKLSDNLWQQANVRRTKRDVPTCLPCQQRAQVIHWWKCALTTFAAEFVIIEGKSNCHLLLQFGKDNKTRRRHHNLPSIVIFKCNTLLYIRKCWKYTAGQVAYMGHTQSKHLDSCCVDLEECG